MYNLHVNRKAIVVVLDNVRHSQNRNNICRQTIPRRIRHHHLQFCLVAYHKYDGINGCGGSEPTGYSRERYLSLFQCSGVYRELQPVQSHRRCRCLAEELIYHQVIHVDIR